MAGALKPARNDYERSQTFWSWSPLAAEDLS
jgi:hypothetical protein